MRACCLSCAQPVPVDADMGFEVEGVGFAVENKLTEGSAPFRSAS